jgi:hypothetical protein
MRSEQLPLVAIGATVATSWFREDDPVFDAQNRVPPIALRLLQTIAHSL